MNPFQYIRVLWQYKIWLKQMYLSHTTENLCAYLTFKIKQDTLYAR